MVCKCVTLRYTVSAVMVLENFKNCEKPRCKNFKTIYDIVDEQTI